MENDISKKLTELLGDPDGMEKIKAVAASLFGGEKENTEPTPTPDGGGLFGDINPAVLMNLMSAMQSNTNDSRASLLLALKPHLSEERQSRVDSAVKLLKIASLMPMLKNFI